MGLNANPHLRKTNVSNSIYMEHALELLRIERDKLKEEFSIAINKEPKDWDTIVRNERLLEELYKAIEILSLVG
jgi:hypothetical protein